MKGEEEEERRKKGRKKQEESRKEGGQRSRRQVGRKGEKEESCPAMKELEDIRGSDYLKTHVMEENRFLGRRGFNHYDSFPRYSSSFHVSSYSRKGMKPIFPSIIFFSISFQIQANQILKSLHICKSAVNLQKILYSIWDYCPGPSIPLISCIRTCRRI